jgi:hypothetical protein
MSLDQPLTIDDIEMAFNMLLERSAGNEAVQIYKTHAVDAGWTRRQLREAIIASPEYGIKTGKPMQMYYEGFTFFVNPQELEIGRGIANSPEHTYEAHNLRLLREILQPGDTFIDVGANIGILSLAARTAVGETGRVICFEPMADNAALLVRSIIANDFNNNPSYG